MTSEVAVWRRSRRQRQPRQTRRRSPRQSRRPSATRPPRISAPLEPPVTYDITDDMPRFEDDDDGEFEILAPRKPKRPAPIPAAAPAAPRRRSTFDRLLLGVEVLAVIGIIGVLVVGGYLIATENDKIEALEQKSADIQREAEAMRATATPAPVLSVRLSDYVLPGGHYSPNETGGGEAFNLEELPESVRPRRWPSSTARPRPR